MKKYFWRLFSLLAAISCLSSSAFAINIYERMFINAAMDNNTTMLIQLLILSRDPEFPGTFIRGTFRPKEAINIDVQDERGYTALHYAAHNKNLEMVDYLLKEGAFSYLEDELRRSPLHIAALRTGNIEILHSLVEKGGALPNQRDRNGQTPLHYATKNNSISRAKALLQLGADPTIRDNEDQTPADLTEKEAIQDLLANAANINKTMLYLAKIFALREENVRITKQVDVESIDIEIETRRAEIAEINREISILREEISTLQRRIDEIPGASEDDENPSVKEKRRKCALIARKRFDIRRKESNIQSLGFEKTEIEENSRELLAKRGNNAYVIRETSETLVTLRILEAIPEENDFEIIANLIEGGANLFYSEEEHMNLFYWLARFQGENTSTEGLEEILLEKISISKRCTIEYFNQMDRSEKSAIDYVENPERFFEDEGIRVIGNLCTSFGGARCYRRTSWGTTISLNEILGTEGNFTESSTNEKFLRIWNLGITPPPERATFRYGYRQIWSEEAEAFEYERYEFRDPISTEYPEDFTEYRNFIQEIGPLKLRLVLKGIYR